MYGQGERLLVKTPQSLRVGNEEDLRPEVLAQELFFHHTRPPSRVDHVIDQLQQGIPLFTLRGVATVERGVPREVGVNLVFHVPLDLQANVLTPPGNSPYEKWTWGSRQYLALVQQVPPQYYLAAWEWLKDYKYAYMLKDLSGPEKLAEIRCLPAHYHTACIDVVGFDSRVLSRQGLISPKQVLPVDRACSQDGISTQEIHQAIKYYVERMGNPDLRK